MYGAYYNVCGNKKTTHLQKFANGLVCSKTLNDAFTTERSSCFHTTDFYKHKNNKFGFRP